MNGLTMLIETSEECHSCPACQKIHLPPKIASDECSDPSYSI